MTFLKRSVLAAAASLLAAVTAFGAAGSAQAASTGFKLCNYGSDYTVDASFPGRAWASTPRVWPGQCSETWYVGAYEQFTISARAISNPATTPQRWDVTFGGGRTLVQTWASFGSFTYGKLPY